MEKIWKGRITIDGVDCVKVPVSLLRHRLAIIPQVGVFDYYFLYIFAVVPLAFDPSTRHNFIIILYKLTSFCIKFCSFQDPVMFSGNIRDNLDPFHERSDNEVEII
jgi:hypothetical protein